MLSLIPVLVRGNLGQFVIAVHYEPMRIIKGIMEDRWSLSMVVGVGGGSSDIHDVDLGRISILVPCQPTIFDGQ